MATITSASGGSWGTGATWVGGVVPADDDAVVIAEGHAVLMNADLSGYTGLRTLTITGSAAGTPGMLYFADGTSGYLKFRTGTDYGILGTNVTNKGRLLANSNGTWGGTTPLAYANKAVIDLVGTSRIIATHLDIALYCTNPSTLYVETYGTAYTCTTQSTDVNATTDVITFTSAPPTQGTAVMVRSSGTLPGGLTTTGLYYTRTISGNTCKLALQNSDDTIVDLTSTGSGTLTMYSGHTNTSTATMNVIQDVTAVTGWDATDGHDRVVLADAGPDNYDIQRLQLTTINSGSIVLSANVNSVQYPGARIYVSSRNVSIRNNNNIAAQAIVDFSAATTRSGIFQCEIVNTTGGYGYGINNGTGHTVSGTISGCYYGLSSGTGHTVSAIISGCDNGINSGTGHTVSGTISGCSNGISSGTGHTVSGTISECSTGLNSGTGHTVSGTINGCNNGLNSGSGHTVSGTISKCSTGLNSGSGHTVSGTISECNNGINYGSGHTVSGTISKCSYGLNSGSGHTVSGTISECSYGINYGSGHTVSGTISKCNNGINYAGFTAHNLTFSGNTIDISYLGYYQGQVMNGRCFRYGGTANDTRAWTAGGKLAHETSEVPSGKSYSHKFTYEDGTYWTYMFWEVDRTEALAISLVVHAKHDATSLTADQRIHWQVIDPSVDPFVSASNVPIAEWIAADSTDWQSSTLSYTRTDDRPVYIRCCAKLASGTAYIYLEPAAASAGGLIVHPGMTGGCNG